MSDNEYWSNIDGIINPMSENPVYVCGGSHFKCGNEALGVFLCWWLEADRLKSSPVSVSLSTEGGV